MKKEFKIEYYPYKDITNYFLQATILSIILELGLLIFVILMEMFSNDLIGSIAFLLLPIAFYILFLLSVFILTRYKITIDYKGNSLLVKKPLSKKKYILSDVTIKKQYVKCSFNNPDLLFLIFIYSNKKILKIDALNFENNTNFKIEDII